MEVKEGGVTRGLILKNGMSGRKMGMGHKPPLKREKAENPHTLEPLEEELTRRPTTSKNDVSLGAFIASDAITLLPLAQGEKRCMSPEQHTSPNAKFYFTSPNGP